MSHFFKRLKWLMLVIAFAGISSCASINEKKPSYDFYQLQPLPTSLQNKVFLETLMFEQEEQRTLLTQIETSEQSLSLGAMTYSGLPIIQAKWHSSEGLIGFASKIFDKSMVLRIIRDIQLVKWPDNNLKAGLLADHSLTSSQKSTTKRVREIQNSGKTVVKIIYSGKKIVLINTIENYQLTIEQVNE